MAGLSGSGFAIASRTLLLNSTYEPLRVISWQRAVALVYLGKVEVIHTYETVLRSVSTCMQAPAVVRLMTLVRRRRGRISFSRRNVFLRDDFRCQYCGVHLPPSELTADHVVPRSRGGRTTWENVVTACMPCNRRKGCSTPSQAHMALRRKPERPSHLPAPVLRISQDSTPESWREFLACGGM